MPKLSVWDTLNLHEYPFKNEEAAEDRSVRGIAQEGDTGYVVSL